MKTNFASGNVLYKQSTALELPCQHSVICFPILIHVRFGVLSTKLQKFSQLSTNKWKNTFKHNPLAIVFINSWVEYFRILEQADILREIFLMVLLHIYCISHSLPCSPVIFYYCELFSLINVDLHKSFPLKHHNIYFHHNTEITQTLFHFFSSLSPLFTQNTLYSLSHLFASKWMINY